MWDTIALLGAALTLGLGITFWPWWKSYVLRHYRTPMERWHDAQDALERATSKESDEDS